LATTLARKLALEALGDRQGMVLTHLDRLIAQQGPPPQETHLAMELVRGVVRRQRTLDAIIAAFSERPGRKMPDDLRNILRLAAYQLVFLDRVPDFAAVNEAVEAVRAHHPRMAGFVNALCRNVARSLSAAEEGPVPADGAAVPLTNTSYRRFDKPLFVPAATSPQRWLGQTCSLGDDLATRWYARKNSQLKGAFALAMTANARPPVAARVNLVRMSLEQATAALNEAGAGCVSHEAGRNVVFTGAVNIPTLDLFRQGILTPQDASATAVVPELNIQPGQRVLDLCAAPGTKTTHIAELLKGRGEVVAADVSPEKLARIAESAQRCRLDNIRPILAEQVGSLQPGSFDRVLVDAPCSNTGVLARRVEARWRFHADDLGRICADQRRLLELGALFLSPAGRMVYSTCSIEPEEDDGVVQAFLSRQRSFKRLSHTLLEPAGFAAPEQYHDGGYRAVLIRQ
jgi:16S rRNA (cytosine967-C5)-methyltransferase